MSVGLPVANRQLAAVTIAARTLTPVGPLVINDGRQRLPAPAPATTLAAASDGTPFDIYAVQAPVNTYTLLALPQGTDTSARRDLALIGRAIDYPTKSAAIFIPAAGSSLASAIYVDALGVHISPTATAFLPYPTGSIVIDPVPGTQNSALLWLSNDDLQTRIHNYIPGYSDSSKQQGMWIYSHGSMSIGADAGQVIYADTVRIQSRNGTTIEQFNGVGATNAYDAYGRQRKYQASPPSFAVTAGAGAGATGAAVGADEYGRVALTTGSAPQGGQVALCAITYANALPAAPYGVILSPANAAASALARNQDVFAPQSAVVAGGFSVYSGAVALAAATAYLWNYRVLVA